MNEEDRPISVEEAADAARRLAWHLVLILLLLFALLMMPAALSLGSLAEQHRAQTIHQVSR